ncbi:MAG: hypothetical protein WD342_02170 [Verrucomicrobiales bacterium]
MKHFIFTFVYLILSILPTSTGFAEDTLGYYENLSAILFLYGAERIETVAEDDKSAALGEMVYMAFHYFLEVSENAIPSSEKVQKSISIFYTKVTKQYGYADEIFSDPLFRREGRRGLSLPEHLAFSDENYEEVVEDFLKFVRLENGETSRTQD